MRLFQSSITAETLQLIEKYVPNIKINVLRSYLVDGPGTCKIFTNAGHCVDMIVLDSSTYSLFQGNHKCHISLKTYADFLKNNCECYHAYFGFDPIHGNNGTEESITSQIYLESLGLHPVPVIQNLDLETEYYCKRHNHYNFVAIGSTRSKKEDEINKAVNKLYDKGIKVHLFGVGSLIKLKDIPIWSSDCSSFAKWVEAGRLVYFNGEKEITFSTSKFNTKGEKNDDFIEDSPYRDDYENWVFEKLGLTLDKITHNHSMKMMVNSYYFYELQKMLQNIHKLKGFSFDVY